MRLLSTAFAHAAGLGPTEIADAIGRSGAEGALFDAGLDGARLEILQREFFGRAIAIEAPCPRSPASVAMLVSPDRAEAEAAREAAEATVRLAGELGARFVVLRLGEVRELAPNWRRARDRFLRGELDDDEALSLDRAREDSAERALDQARRALDRLARAAEAAGVTLCLRNRRRYVELPSACEVELLLAHCAGAPIAPLYDSAAAHLCELMGFEPEGLALAAFGARAPLVYLGDACGAVGALPPGRGLLDVAALRAKLPADAVRAFSPWAGLTVEEAVAAVAAI